MIQKLVHKIGPLPLTFSVKQHKMTTEGGEASEKLVD